MSFATPPHGRTGPVLPLAGMVDVLFLLLIFFMTTSVFREHDEQIDVSLPASESGAASTRPTQISITITEEDEIFIGERQYLPAQLLDTLRDLAIQFPDESVVIRGDHGSSLGVAVKVMDIAHAANLYNVHLGTRPPDEE